MVVSVPAGLKQAWPCPRLIVNTTGIRGIEFILQSNTFTHLPKPVYVSTISQPLLLYYNDNTAAWIVARDSHANDVILGIDGSVISHVPFGESRSGDDVITIMCQGECSNL